MRAVDISAAGFAAFDDSLAREAIHDGHNGRIGARAPFGEPVANIANRAFADGPKRVHAIEFEGGEIEDRAAARGSIWAPVVRVVGDRNHGCKSTTCERSRTT